MTESEKRIAPFGLRMPPQLKEKVQRAAEVSNRSMNAEIISRLEASFDSVGGLISQLDDERLERVLKLMLQKADEIVRERSSDGS